MNKRKIAVVTGSRAEYGLLYWLLKEIKNDPALDLQLIATGSHFVPELGNTYQEIEGDGFSIAARIDMKLTSDTADGILRSMGTELHGFADALTKLKPDLMVVLGDRYEILVAATAALICKIPLAHLCGGDATEGAFDESIRHAITKLSHFHFVTNNRAQKRVCQMGENPEHVLNFGSLSVENIRRQKLLDRTQLQTDLRVEFQKKNFLVTYHPETLSERDPSGDFSELLGALKEFKDIGVFFTLPNADTGGRKLLPMIEIFTASNPNAKAFASLGAHRYLSLMNVCDVVVGNSSSGVYEAPSLKVPTVNIGDRQKGRFAAQSVFHCGPTKKQIAETITKALQADRTQISNPYEGEQTAERIKNFLRDISNPKTILVKKFHDAGAK